MDWNEVLKGLLTALGVGLLIGVVRERHYGPSVSKAGLRTHALVALLGAVAMGFGMPAFIALLLIVGAYAIAGYWNSHRDDPGLTGEVALLVSAMLGALARLAVLTGERSEGRAHRQISLSCRGDARHHIAIDRIVKYAQQQDIP